VHLIDATNAEAYLRDVGRVSPAERVTVRELAGGVSNVVLLVEFQDNAREPFVLKQAREQLRVAQPWFCSPERIWREVEVLRVCDSLGLENIATTRRIGMPTVLFEDREAYAFGMTAAPAHAKPWKEALLLAGRVDRSIATACGVLLGTLHARTWQSSDVAGRLGSQEYFQELRIDPYYRQIARVHPAIASQIDNLIAGLADHPRCLVHGDFSPKNLLVSDEEVILIDCEVGHYGDPAFDLGFFLSHLKLKMIHRRDLAFVGASSAFCRAYRETIEPRIGLEELRSLDQRATMALAACLLARVDGKSPVEYLSEEDRVLVRKMAIESLSPWRELIHAPTSLFF
jgi:5-methylthioribose kinase